MIILVWLEVSIFIMGDQVYKNNEIKRFPRRLHGKTPTCSARDAGSIPGFGKISWRRKWHPTTVFFSEKSHGQRSLAGYRPWGHKQSDTTEWQHTHTFHSFISTNVSEDPRLTKHCTVWGTWRPPPEFTFHRGGRWTITKQSRTKRKMN